MIILDVTIEDRSPLRGIGRHWRKIQREGMRRVAMMWHDAILPRHFFPSNRSAYQHEPRNKLYLQKIKPVTGKGSGKYVDDLLSGRSRMQMLLGAKITATQGKATVHMRPPGYFTNPFVGSYTDRRTGRVKKITRQPDKPAEITRISDTDREFLRRVLQDNLQRMFAQAHAGITETFS